MLHYKFITALVVSLFWQSVFAQELFVFSEPASNMPKKSVGIRVTDLVMHEEVLPKNGNFLIPEVMWGMNKHIMLHVSSFFSNTNGGFAYNGAGLYLKYRFYSTDKVHRHFRMAAFGRATSNNSPLRQEAIETYGRNSGYQLGGIGTQLLHKTAISVTAYYEQALDVKMDRLSPYMSPRKAFNYSLSFGRLILPKQYNNYKQTNLNLMVELLAQVLPENGQQYFDIAPSLQLILNSQTRIDVGYRQELRSTMYRDAPNGALIRIEHLFYNLL